MIEKKLIGKLPVLLGEYDNTKTYGKKQRVTLYGSEFESKVDNNTVAPATFSNNTLTINTDNWRVVSNGTEAFLAGEKLKQLNVIENPEYITADIDADNVLLESTDIEGNKRFYKNVNIDGNLSIKGENVYKKLENAVTKEDNKSLINSEIADSLSIEDNPEFVEVILDKNNKVISERDNKGILHENIGIKTKKIDAEEVSNSLLNNIQSALHERGFDNVYIHHDWSNYSTIKIDKPKIALVNISNISKMPETKTTNAKAFLEFWDDKGNYFKKKVILNAQGNSSMGMPKKNFAIDFVEDNWIGDKTTSVKFGSWVTQDSYHAKAFYTDFFRGLSLCTYQFYEQIVRTRGISEDKPWKKALIKQAGIGNVATSFNDIIDNDITLQLDNGALCHPDGFPTIVYLNDEFYGIFILMLKKHRDNYHLNKETAEHIELDPNSSINGIFNNNIPWDDMTIRNPKSLICMDGSKYDGNNPKELIDDTSEKYNASNKDHKRSAKVKSYIVELSKVTDALNSAEAIYNASSKTSNDLVILQEVFKQYFDVDNLVDYTIANDVVGNTDAWQKNWQWITYNGKKWYVGLYDCDCVFGNSPWGEECRTPKDYHMAKFTNSDEALMKIPIGWLLKYFSAELNERYKYLSEKGIITSDNIISFIKTLTDTIGTDYYELEYKKWFDSPCNKQCAVRSEYWKLVKDDNGNYVKTNIETFDARKSYAVNDVVSFGKNEESGFYQFICIKETIALSSNIPHTVSDYSPISKFGYIDNIYRVENWIKTHIQQCDKLYNYIR